MYLWVQNFLFHHEQRVAWYEQHFLCSLCAPQLCSHSYCTAQQALLTPVAPSPVCTAAVLLEALEHQVQYRVCVARTGLILLYKLWICRNFDVLWNESWVRTAEREWGLEDCSLLWFNVLNHRTRKHHTCAKIGLCVWLMTALLRVDVMCVHTHEQDDAYWIFSW